MSRHDLGAVEDLCRLVVLVRRLGCRLHLVDVDEELLGLLDLAGVGDIVGRCPAHRPNSNRLNTKGDLR